MKTLFIISLLISIFGTAIPQSGMVKVPKQISLEAGYRNNFYIDNIDSIARNGLSFAFDYAWQLSGLDKSRPAVYLSVPLGYEIMPGSNANSKKSASFLFYGWSIRHELAVGRKMIPYLGYGLLLNRIYINDTEGSAMGHQTRFEFGINLPTSEKTIFFSRVDYSYTSYPSLGNDEKIKLHALGLKAGVRF
jgi:hypothetical protein